MPKIMVWNIQELTSEKLNDHRARQHIFENLYPSQEGIPTPDIFAVLEVVNDVAFLGQKENIKRGQLINQVVNGVQPHHNQGMHTVLRLHELLQQRNDDWCLVPPLSLAGGTLSNRVIAVFYRKSKVTFCGPGIWTKDDRAVVSEEFEHIVDKASRVHFDENFDEERRNGLPDPWQSCLQPLANVNVRLPAYIGGEKNQIYLSGFVDFVEKGFPSKKVRTPILTCFRENTPEGEYDPDGRLINLLVWHSRPPLKGRIRETIIGYTNNLALIAHTIHSLSLDSQENAVTIVAGDFNIGGVLSEEQPDDEAFKEFTGYGFDRRFKQTWESRDRFHPTAGPTTMVTPIAAITNILNPIEAELLYPHLFMYITENGAQRKNPGYAIDNIFTKGISVDETSALIIERVAGNSYNDVMNVETNRYSYDMNKELPFLIKGIQGDNPAIVANAFYSSENYGGIRGGEAEPKTWKNPGENGSIASIRESIISTKLKINQRLLELHNKTDKLRELLEGKKYLLGRLQEFNQEVSSSANELFNLVTKYQSNEKKLLSTIRSILSLTKQMEAFLGLSGDLVQWQEFNKFQNIINARITDAQKSFIGGNFSSFNIHAHVETMMHTVEALLSYLPINDNLLELNWEKKTIRYGLQGLENDMAIAIEKLPDRVFEEMTKHGLEDEKFKEKLFNQGKQEIENRFSEEIERLRTDLDAINLRLAEYREEFGDEIRNSKELENQLEKHNDILSNFIETFQTILQFYTELLEQSEAQLNLLNFVIEKYPEKFNSSEEVLSNFTKQVESIAKTLDPLKEQNLQIISDSAQIFPEMNGSLENWQQVTEELSALDLELDEYQDTISNSEASEELVNLNKELTRLRYVGAKHQIDRMLKNITNPIIGVSDHMALVLDF